MSDIPFRGSPRQVQFALESISREAWTRSAEIFDYMDQFEGNGLKEILAKVDTSELEDMFWEFYGALAFCPIADDDLYDLAILSACTLPGGKTEHPKRFRAYATHGKNLGVFVSSIRQDKRIPRNITELVEFAKNSVHYTAGGNTPLVLVPKSVSSAAGEFLYRQFFKTTREVYSLRLSDDVELIHHMSMSFMLSMDSLTGNRFKDSNEAIRTLSAFLRDY